MKISYVFMRAGADDIDIIYISIVKHKNTDVHCSICGMKLTEKQLVIMVMGVVI